MNSSRFLFAFLGLFVGLSAFAQTPYYKNLTNMDGLPSNSIYSVFSARSGQMFFGTSSGLASYDGVRFVRYANPEGKTRSITEVSEDADGVIWGINFSNQLFFLEGNELRPYSVVDSLVAMGHQLVNYVHLPKGPVILTDRGLFMVEKSNGHVKLLYNEQASGPHVYVAYDPLEQVIILCVVGNVIQFDASGRLIKKDRIGFYSTRPKAFGNEIFLNSRGATKHISILGKPPIEISPKIPSKTNWNLWVNINGQPWITSNYGIHWYDAQKNRLNPGFFMEKRVSDVSTDHEGNIWVGTLDEGLFLIPSLDILIFEPDNRRGLVKSFTSLAYDGDKYIFAGSADGFIYKFNIDGSQKFVYDTEANNGIEFLRYQPENQKIYHSFGSSNSQFGDRKRATFGKGVRWDAFGNFLITGSGATYIVPLIDKKRGLQPNFLNVYQSIFSGALSDSVIPLDLSRGRSALVLDTGYLIGTENGLFLIHEEGKFHYTFESKKVIALDLFQEKNGTVWVGTIPHGLLKISGDSLLQPFPDAVIACQKIISDHMNGLWLITDNQLGYINSETGFFRNISKNIPLLGLELNDLVFTSNNELLIATNLGIVKIPYLIAFESQPPQVIIKEVRNQYSVLKDIDRVKIPSKNNQLSFELITYHYRSFGNFEMEYRLPGVQETWQRITPQNNVVRFVSLPPNKYNFEVRSVLNDRYSEITTTTFEILPPFWQKWWFLLLMFFFVSALVFIGHRLVLLNIQKRETVKEHLALSQITALRAQMSPHFIFNILNSVQGLIYADQKAKASDLLGRFSELIRNTLDYSGKNVISLKREIEHLKTYISLEKERFEDEFDYEILADDNLNSEKIEIPSMILQPFVENAIKHGLLHKWGTKILRIYFRELEQGWLQVEVDDNGVGRKNAMHIEKQKRKHESFATSAIDQRIALMNQISEKKVIIKIIDKKDSVGNATGTRILINIPYESYHH